MDCLEKIKLIRSKQSPLIKIISEDPGGSLFHTVSMYDPKQDALITCASTQIGCVEDCTFCATGAFPFIRNLTIEEMKHQYTLGIGCLKKFQLKNHPAALCILLEGMGEPTYNIKNSLIAFKEIYPDILYKFNRIIFRISTSGNIGFITELKEIIRDNPEFVTNNYLQMQLSLHSPFDRERRWLMPSASANHSIKEILSGLYPLCDLLGSKLICNYMLLDFPVDGCNYSIDHLNEIIRLLDNKKVEIKLTTYSETSKNFISPAPYIFEDIKSYFVEYGYKIKIKTLLGKDVQASCGMLHYQ